MVELLRKQSTSVLLAFVAIGFIFVLVELALMGHYAAGSQLLGFAATAVGLLISLIAFAPNLRRIALILFLILALVGLYGAYEHRQGRNERAVEAAPAIQAATDKIDKEALEKFISNPPILSPLALSGLSSLGMLVLLLAAGEPKPK